MQRNTWTNEEKETLQSQFKGGVEDGVIATLLPNHTFASIQAKRIEMGLRRNKSRLTKHYKPWTSSDIEFLTVKKEKGKSTSYIAKKLGRTKSSVNSMYSKVLTSTASVMGGEERTVVVNEDEKKPIVLNIATAQMLGFPMLNDMMRKCMKENRMFVVGDDTIN